MQSRLGIRIFGGVFSSLTSKPQLHKKPSDRRALYVSQGAVVASQRTDLLDRVLRSSRDANIESPDCRFSIRIDHSREFARRPDSALLRQRNLSDIRRLAEILFVDTDETNAHETSRVGG